MIVGLALFCASPLTAADSLQLKDGTKVEGVIQKVEAGIVFMEVNKEVKTFDILAVDRMEFNKPTILADSDLPLDHFMNNTEAQAMVRNAEQLDKAANDIRRLLVQIRSYWFDKQPINAKDEQMWEAAKETFRLPLANYQEVLNDLYFQVLARVDEYNGLMKEANKLYVGIKGIRVGSGLVSSDMEHLPLKKYVPASWYDTIFYEGYNSGFSDAMQRMTPSSR
jgi:hypothetical protein